MIKSANDKNLLRKLDTKQHARKYFDTATPYLSPSLRMCILIKKKLILVVKLFCDLLNLPITKINYTKSTIYDPIAKINYRNLLFFDQ